MVRAGAPKPFWADAIEWEAYIQSNTTWDIYQLQGETPETVLSGETADISQFCDLSFYEWVMFQDEPVAFPDENPVLGQFLGVAINVGPAMTAKILTQKWRSCLPIHLSWTDRRRGGESCSHCTLRGG